MNEKLVTYVLGMINRLEWLLEKSKAGLSQSENRDEVAQAELEDQERVLRHMRRTANKLQVEVASKDFANAFRSLQIIYALNQMVGVHVVSTYLTNASKKSSVPVQIEEVSMVQTCH